MINNTMRPIPVTMQHAVQAGAIGSHQNLPPLPTAGLPITSTRLPTNVGTVSRPGIGVRPRATPILSQGGLRNYPSAPGIVIQPVGVRSPLTAYPAGNPGGVAMPHWPQS